MCSNFSSSSEFRGFDIIQVADEFLCRGRQGHIFQPDGADAPGGDFLHGLDFEKPASVQFISDEILYYAGDTEIIFGKLDQKVHVAQFKSRGDGHRISLEILVHE